MSEDNIVLSQALQYAEQGFPVFPVHKMTGKTCSCHRGKTCPSPGKHPAVDGWPELATTDEHQIRMWFDKVYKGHNVGIFLGNNLVCLDVDISEEKEKDGAIKLSALEEELGELPKGGNVQRTASGGNHYLFKTKEPLGRHVSKDQSSPWYGLDVLAGNSFIVAAPSRTAKGPYSWISCDGTVPRMDEIPSLPADWVVRLKEVTSIPVSSGKDRDSVKAEQGLVTKVMNDLPEVDLSFGVDDATFEKITAALSWIPASGWEESNSWFKILGAIKIAACDQRGLNLACDWSSSTNEAGEQAIEYKDDDDVAYHWSRCSSPMEAAPDDASYTSIFYYAEKFGYPKNGQAKNYTTNTNGDLLIEFSVAKLDDAGIGATMPVTEDLIKATDGMVDAEFFSQYHQESLDPPACLTDCTAMVGVLSDIQTYIESKNASPQPVLAAMAAFSTLATMTRRAYVGSPELKNTRMNLMAVAVAPSGGGKDASLKGGAQILRECGLGDCVGRESKSGSAYHSQLVNTPNVLFTQDEIGKWWQYTQGVATHANTIKTFFLKAFTSSNEAGFVGIEYAGAGKANNIEEVDYPHANLYGVTTPQSFYDALSMADMHEGLIGRMLVVESELRPELKRKVTEDKAALDAILRFNSKMDEHIRKGNAASMAGFGADDPVVVEITEDADEMIWQKGQEIRNTMLPKLDEKGLAEAYGRWGELVNKLACLMAIAKNPVEPVVTNMEATYAMQIVDYCCAKWVRIFDSQGVNETVEGTIKKKIVDFLKDNPKFKMKDTKTGDFTFEKMTEGRLRNRLSIKANDFESALQSLIEGDIVASTSYKNGKGKVVSRVWLKSAGDPE